MKIVNVCSSKGGTGKTTIATRLAQHLPGNVGLLDADLESATCARELDLNPNQRAEFTDSHEITPIDIDGIKLYSMSVLFDSPAISQKESFYEMVYKEAINDADWGELDYLVVDSPPGTSVKFRPLIESMRENLAGVIIVSQSDWAEEAEKITRVCNARWIPILGFVENMSGEYFGEGKIETFASELGANFLGKIPLSKSEEELMESMEPVLDNVQDLLESTDEYAPLPPERRNPPSKMDLVKAVANMVSEVNERYPIEQLRKRFGRSGPPAVVGIEIVDKVENPGIAQKIAQKFGVMDGDTIRMHFAVDDGNISLKRNPKEIEGVIRIPSWELEAILRGEKEMLNAATGTTYVEDNYTPVDSVRMGNAEIKGKKAFSRLSLLDAVLSTTKDIRG